MGFYSDQVVPRAVGVVCGSGFLDWWREQVCAGLFGDVLEIGFGSGANLAHLSASVSHLYAVEPSNVARALARSRLARSALDVSFVTASDDVLALADQSVDAALCTFTLCSVARPDRLLSEVVRVLKPGAALHFLEHGLAPGPLMAASQRRLDGLEQRLAGGCHLDRDPLALLAGSALEVRWSRQSYAGVATPWSFFTLGEARAVLG